MRWFKCEEGDTAFQFSGNPPTRRSGHTSNFVDGKQPYVVVFGGILDKAFLAELTVLEIENNFWFSPEYPKDPSSSFPVPRAFHSAVSLGSNLFIFGGRSSTLCLGDFWMLDTDTWTWTELSAYGEQPPQREFSTMVAVGTDRLLLFGGWDGTKWLSDLYVLDTMSLTWRQLAATGAIPSPRCGHTATMVEKRLLTFGGRGAGGVINSELWALKGIFNDAETSWVQLKLPGNSPVGRCGHSCTAFGPLLLIFGGHGLVGWITRQSVYFNDAVVLDRASVQWRTLSISGDCPAPRAYHTLTQVKHRMLLIGGYDGSTTFSDVWWLLRDDDPLAVKSVEMERKLESSAAAVAAAKSKAADIEKSMAAQAPVRKASPAGVRSDSAEQPDFPFEKLRIRMGLPPFSSGILPPVSQKFDGLDDPSLIHLGLRVTSKEKGGGRVVSSAQDAVMAARRYLTALEPGSVPLKDLDVLLRDYKRMVCYFQGLNDGDRSAGIHKLYHIESCKQLRIGDIALLLNEYQTFSRRVLS